MPKECANDLPTVPLQHNLTLEGVLFLFARVEGALTPPLTLNRCLGDIHYHYLRFAKSSQQLFFACQAKLSTAHQMVLDPANNAVDGCLTHPPTTADVKVGAVLSLLFQAHQDSITGR